MNKIIPLTFLLLSSIVLETYGFEISNQYSDKYDFGKKKIKISCSQNDAEIFVNDQLSGKGYVEIKVPDEGCTSVVIKKVGYIVEKMDFCNKKNMVKLPSKYHFNLIKDAAYEFTMKSDIINKDLTIPTEYSKDEAWKLINQIVLNNFDEIEISDKETGYVRTSWVVKRFEHSAVRTRFILKQFSSNPLVFKIKLSSEHSQNKMANSNAGEYFKEWNQVLKQYTSLVNEIQARVK
jgi:hypothetical protein